MSDTPVLPATFPPPAKLDVLKGFIGDLARPFALISTSLSASISMVVISVRTPQPDYSTGAIFIGAVGAFVGGIYTAKAWEVAKTGKHAAEVEIARSAGPPAGG